jgi:hypothetical protein
MWGPFVIQYNFFFAWPASFSLTPRSERHICDDSSAATPPPAFASTPPPLLFPSRSSRWREWRRTRSCSKVGVFFPTPGHGTHGHHLVVAVPFPILGAGSWSSRQKSQVLGGGRIPSSLRDWRMDFEGLKKKKTSLGARMGICWSSQIPQITGFSHWGWKWGDWWRCSNHIFTDGWFCSHSPCTIWITYNWRSDFLAMTLVCSPHFVTHLQFRDKHCLIQLKLQTKLNTGDIPGFKTHKNFDTPALLIGYHFQSYLHLKVLNTSNYSLHA